MDNSPPHPYQSIMPKHLIIVIGGILSAAIIHLYVLLSEGFIYVDIKSSGMLILMGLMILVTYAITSASDQINKLIPWNKFPLSRIGLGTSVHSIIVFVVFYMFYTTYWDTQIFRTFTESTFSDVTKIKLAIVIFVLAFLFYILQYATVSYQYYAHTQIKQKQLQREIVDVQFDVLKSQLRPHFLFNSLNTISSLLHNDDSSAESYIRKLAKSYEYTLNNYNAQWVSITQEVAFVQDYVDMMKIRFGNNLRLNIHITEEEKKRKVMPLSLQLLVENAIKHNVVDTNQELNIDIETAPKTIIVTNNKTVQPSFTMSHKIGLSNLKKRYDLWSHQSIDIVETQKSFSVQIPLN